MFAQTFVLPNAYEATHISPLIVRPMSTSCYSLSGGYISPTAYGPVDLYIAGWGTPLYGASSEVTWRFTAVDDPTSTLQQGTLPYFEVADLEVGSVLNTATNRTNILVAYYKLGVGHFVDVYEVTTSLSNPIVPVSSMQLSASTTYGRIRMDCHSVHTAGLVWENPGAGIETIMNKEGSWSLVSILDGTAGQSGPDMAFAYNNNKLNVHYVYHDNAGTITESVVDYNTFWAVPGVVVPNVQDVNSVGANIGSRLVLDCPDHYDNADNWAYTYTDGTNKEVYVRFIDYNGAAVATTVSVNSGALGNASIAGMYEAYAPTLHYGNGAIGGSTEQINVAWYITDGSLNGYVGLQMNADGTGLLSTPDYLILPNAFTAAPYILRKGVAYSKSDAKSVPSFLYATYYDYNNVTGSYQLHHAFHKWGDIAFKEGATAIGKQQGAAAGFDIYPNPFQDNLSAAVTLQESGVLQLSLLDLAGRAVWQTQARLGAGTHRIAVKDLGKLAPGAYVLHAAFNNRQVGSRMITKQ